MAGEFFHYAFLQGRLIGSEHPDAHGRPSACVDRVLAGRTPATLLTLTRLPLADLRISGVSQRHIPIGDSPTRDQIAEAVRIVAERLDAGNSVWVHCQRGIDRTACVIGSYLVSTGTAADKVIAELFDRFPPSFASPRMRELWETNAQIIRSFAVAKRGATEPSGS
jgi:hypothetical protein